MAAARYYTWDRLGRPLEPAQPIRELVERLKVAFPRAAADHLFGWGANEAHYQADPPQDHTPFSDDGWPAPDPQWVVCATDVMHRVDLGVDCNALFPYWLNEARAGRMPWLKYMIYQATIYDVRYGWKPQPSVGHFDHVHISTRTDHIDTHLGSWSLVPQEADMTPAQSAALTDALNILTGLAAGADSAAVHDKDGTLSLVPLYARVAAEVVTRLPAGSPDSAATLARIDALEAKLAAAAHAEADALDG